MRNLHDRRSFLARVTGTAACGAALGAASLGAQAPPPRAAAGDAREIKPAAWDLAWLDAFKGTHKRVYDYQWHTLRPNTLNPPKNYLDVWKDEWGLEFPAVNVAIGFNEVAINASDALWATFKLGERFNVIDAETGRPATRNVYLGTGPGDPRGSFKGLQARGVVFWMCNKSLNSTSADLARDFGRAKADVYQELLGGFLPGVRLVPAHTWAVAAVQERGFTYQKL